jgi:RimJ/RimL family protein N-acetyltransferase
VTDGKPTDPAIRGRRVALRPVFEQDHPSIHRWMNNPEVWHYMDYERPVSLAEVAEDGDRSRREGFPFTIVVGDQAIGRIGLNQFRRRDRICSLYMYIGEPSYWGRGYAQDAVMALLSYAFDRWDLHQVELWLLSDNDRGRATYERCGFVEEATLRERSWKAGAWVDRVVMSIKRAEFQRHELKWRDQQPE